MTKSQTEVFTGGAVLVAPSSCYADQIAQIQLGAFVTKLTFGTGNVAGEIPTAVHTVIMPTAAALAMAEQILEVFRRNEGRPAITNEVESYLKVLKS